MDKLIGSIRAVLHDLRGSVDELEDAEVAAKVLKRLTSAHADIVQARTRAQKAAAWQSKLDAWADAKSGVTKRPSPGRPPKHEFKGMQLGEVRTVEWGGDADTQTYADVHKAMTRSELNLKLDFDMKSQPNKLVITRIA
jgi:hypothetical protein